MKVNVLAGKEINEARKLAYEVLVWEQNWIIPENPTELRVEKGELRDAYDSMATWFGVFDGNTLIGCHRTCGKLDGCFELEQYYHVPNFIKQSDFAIEGTRLAIKKTYRSSTAFFELIHFEWSYLINRDCELFFTTGSFPRPGVLYTRKMGLIRHGKPFRYHEQDPHQVYLFFANKERLKANTERLKTIIAGRFPLTSCP